MPSNLNNKRTYDGPADSRPDLYPASQCGDEPPSVIPGLAVKRALQCSSHLLSASRQGCHRLLPQKNLKRPFNTLLEQPLHVELRYLRAEPCQMTSVTHITTAIVKCFESSELSSQLLTRSSVIDQHDDVQQRVAQDSCTQ